MGCQSFELGGFCGMNYAVDANKVSFNPLPWGIIKQPHLSSWAAFKRAANICPAFTAHELVYFAFN